MQRFSRAGRVVTLGLLGAGGCFHNPPPEVSILSPEPSKVITDYDPIDVQVMASDDSDIDRLELWIDDELVGELVGEELVTGDECKRGCILTIPWFTAESPEGEHTLMVIVEDDEGARTVARRQMKLEDTPTLVLTPADNSNMTGAGDITVSFSMLDRSQLDVEFRIDGELAPGVPTRTQGTCGLGCSIGYEWSTFAVAEGEHELSVTAVDAFGREVTATSLVLIGDIAYVSSIEVTNEFDGADRLEVEVHLFDATTNEFLGCAGEVNGLEAVDGNNINYPVLAPFFHEARNGSVPLSELTSRSLKLWVVEDDGFPPCPGPPAGGDDTIGMSAPFAGANLGSMGSMSFGSVVNLTLNTGRPFRR